MTAPTKILLALLFTLAASAFASDQDIENFKPAPQTKGSASSDQSRLEVKEEVTDTETEATICTLDCHPARPAARTALHHISVDKVK